MSEVMPVAFVGVVGDLCRYWIRLWVLWYNMTFPLKTLAMNCVGTSIAGMLYGLGSVQQIS